MINKNNDINNSAIDSTVENQSDYLREYSDCFRTATKDSSELSKMYISGLLKTEHGKRCMERLHEVLEMEGDGYQQIQHFITYSPWDARKLIRAAALKKSELYSRQLAYDVSDVGYIIDESAHLKKGESSAGVSRQYAGVIGKADCCQAGVYSSLVWQNRTGLIDCRLFLPECRAKDDARCEKAGIPQEARTHKS